MLLKQHFINTIIFYLILLKPILVNNLNQLVERSYQTVFLFSNTDFQSLVVIPHVKLKKCPKQNFWAAKVWVIEELFY